MAQSVERYLGKVEVTGSIPVISLNKKRDIHLDISFFIQFDNVESNMSTGKFEHCSNLMETCLQVSCSTSRYLFKYPQKSGEIDFHHF